MTASIWGGIAVAVGQDGVVNSVAELRALVTAVTFVETTGYYTKGDGGAGSYYYDSADTVSADNGGTIIVAADNKRWKLLISDSLSIKQFGAKGDNAAADQPFIQAALTAAGNWNGSNGIKVIAPPGTYKCAAPLIIPKRVIFTGAGRLSTILTFSNAGDGIQSTWPINSSTAVWISVRDMYLQNTNVAPTGGGFVDVGGTFIEVQNCRIEGFKYEIILDQTEIAIIRNNQLNHAAGRAGIWLVNGPDHTALANIGFTNRITIVENQFDGTGGNENIIDDGGANHTIKDNNFNAGTKVIRVAGVSGLDFSCNESESHTDTQVVLLTTTTKAGVYVGPVFGCSIDKNTFSDAGLNTIGIDEVQGGEITKNVFSLTAGGGAFLFFSNGASNPTTGLRFEHNAKALTGAGRTSARFADAASAVPFNNNSMTQKAMSYVVAPVVAGVGVVVTPATDEFTQIGTKIVCRNADGTNPETVTVTAKAAGTWTATFASNKAANWLAFNATQ